MNIPRPEPPRDLSGSRAPLLESPARLGSEELARRSLARHGLARRRVRAGDLATGRPAQEHLGAHASHCLLEVHGSAPSRVEYNPPVSAVAIELAHSAQYAGPRGVDP